MKAKKNFNWITGLFILGYHAFLLVALPIYFWQHNAPSTGILVFSAALLFITGISVTAGYHRHYSHSTYKIHPVPEAILLFFATMATHGSAIRWSYEHRIHHAFVDTDRDPYSIKKGFWYAHFLWMFEKSNIIEDKVVSDLLRRPMLRFQHKYYGLLMVVTNSIVWLFAGWLSGDYWSSFLFVWMVRLFFLHHFTWFINSLAHTWGARNFCQELSAVDNYIISLVTFGEGYHNYHHTFAYDYRNGVRWYHFDPTKWLIWSLHKLGLASNLRRVHHYQIEEKLLLDRKELILEKLRAKLGNRKDEWEEKVHSLTESIQSKLKETRELCEQYRKAKEAETKEYARELQGQIKTIKKNLKEECQHWITLSRNVLAMD